MKLLPALSRSFAKASSRWQNRLDRQLIAASRESDADILWKKMSRLVAMGANIDVKDEGRPLIGFLSLRGLDGVVAKMIGAGADPNATGPGGETPFILAARQAHAKTMTVLADAGADMTAKTTANHNALDMLLLNFGKLKAKDDAGRQRYREAYGILSTRAGLSFKKKFKQQVFGGKKRKFAVLDETLQRETRLRDAVAHGHVDNARALLAAGVNPDCGADCGAKRPLYYAVSRGRVEMTTLLLSAGASPGGRFSGQGQTPLELATANGHAGVFKALVKAGANPYLPASVLHPDGSRTEMSLADLALANDKRAMADHIRNHMADLDEKLGDVRTKKAVTISPPLLLQKKP